MPRIEVRIHGVWFHMPLVRRTDTTATVLVSNGDERDLPIVARYHANGAVNKVENGAYIAVAS